MTWQDNGQGTHVDMDHVAKVEFDAMGVRVFVPRGSGLHVVAGGSQEAARRLRALVTASGPWVRVRSDDRGGDGCEQFANLAAAVVVEILQAEGGPVARIYTHGGSLVGAAHQPDAVQKVRDWVVAASRATPSAV